MQIIVMCDKKNSVRRHALPVCQGFVTPTTIMYIVVWYVSGALTNSTSKQTLSMFKSDDKPFISLTLMQHLSAAFVGHQDEKDAETNAGHGEE